MSGVYDTVEGSVSEGGSADVLVLELDSPALGPLSTRRFELPEWVGTPRIEAGLSSGS